MTANLPAEQPDPVAEALRLRASDADREKVASVLRDAYVEGRLTAVEHEERLSEVYRDAELTDVSVQNSHALVIVALRSRGAEALLEHHFTRALRLCQVAEAVRAVFSGGQTIGKLGLNRAVALVNRTPDLGTSVATLVEYLEDLDLGSSDVRVWIEGLPATPESASRLLDELAR